MSHFKGLEALKAVLIKGTNYRKIEHSSTNKTVCTCSVSSLSQNDVFEHETYFFSAWKAKYSPPHPRPHLLTL